MTIVIVVHVVRDNFFSSPLLLTLFQCDQTLIIYTSGTTGKPKGVFILTEALLHRYAHHVSHVLIHCKNLMASYKLLSFM